MNGMRNYYQKIQIANFDYLTEAQYIKTNR